MKDGYDVHCDKCLMHNPIYNDIIICERGHDICFNCYAKKYKKHNIKLSKIIETNEIRHFLRRMYESYNI